MRILTFSSPYPPELGGMQSHVYNLTQAFARMGHEVRVVTARGQRPAPVRQRDGAISVVRIPSVNVPKTMTLQYLSASAAYLTWLVLTWRPDILHVHSFWPDLLATKHLCPMVRVVHTAHESLFLTMAEQPRYHRRLRFIVSKVDGLIGPSNELLEAARGFGVPAGRSIFLPNGVDSEKFSPSVPGVIRGQYGLLASTKIVLCPRRLVPKNGVNFLIESIPTILPIHPDTMFVIVGEGPERARLETQTRELGIQDKVIFAGGISNDEINSYYADADLVVLPSLKEATSISALEAMSSSKPIVASNVGGLPHLVSEGVTGLLVPPADPQALATAISGLLSSPDRRRAMGSAARSRVLSELTWDHIARRTTAFYSRVLNLPRNGQSDTEAISLQPITNKHQP
jgi:glycosyltransferase involved in cell wall biosynthesis